ncbi:hypothetical protein [Microvirga sp. 17 mud 1-3]|nr:hypothetical protein [Microvirga sp. 17 mud 1-3]
MDTTRPKPGSRPPGSRSSLKRVAWFVLIYLASLVVFAAAVYGLRGLIPH